MPTNNPANDAYNPPGNLSQDFERFKFGELEVDDLFWFQDNNSDSNVPHRKMSENQGMNLRTRINVNIEPNQVVFMRI